MRAELEALIGLQSFDKRILEDQETVESIPLKVKKMEQPLLDAKARWEAQKKNYDAFMKKRKEKDFSLDEINDRISKQQEKSSGIKTNKEYQAHLKGIEKLNDERVKIEDEILELMEQSEEYEARLKETENEVASEERKIDQFKQELEKEKAEAEAELSVLKGQRGEIADRISGEVYNQYMKLLQSGQGLAVVEVRDEVCQGCNMNIPPQLYVEVRKGEELHTCPQCKRFLFSSHHQERR